MSTKSNPAGGTGTSKEAAATPSLPDITLGEHLDLEASGELPDPHSLPLTDPESTPSPSRPPLRPDATEVALGVKWGLADYGAFMEGRSGQRITRKTAQAVRSGERATAAQAGAYRGHRGPRELRNVALELEPGRRDASQVRSDPETPSRLQVEARPEGASDREDAHRDGSLLEDMDVHHDGSLPDGMDARCDGSLLAGMEERRDGSLPRIERHDGCHPTWSEEDGDGIPKDERDRRRDGHSGEVLCPHSPGMELGTWRDEDGTVIRTYLDPRLIEYMRIIKAPRSLPAWFDLCENGDLLGPLPAEWLPTAATLEDVLVLPDMVYLDANSSFEDEFWREIEVQGDAAEQEDIQRAIAASLSTAEDDFDRRRAERARLEINAIVVEVPEEEAVCPGGADGRYTSAQKQKHVPRPAPPREYLRTFVGRNPNVRAGSEPRQPPPLTSTPLRYQTPASYKRDPSQVPEGRWQGTAGTGRLGSSSERPGGLGGGSGGGRDGGRTPPDSSDSSSSDSSDGDSSESSAETDTPDEEPTPMLRSKSPSAKRHRKKQRDEARQMQRVLKRINLKPPAKWDGTPDLDAYDTWKYNLTTWAELNEAPDYIMVKTMTYYITGKASQFFMNHVAKSEFTWTLENVYDGLFDYCFPEDFNTMLRDRLEFATQGRARVRDYVRDIEQNVTTG